MKDFAWMIVRWTLGLGATAASIWAIVFGFENHAKGAYAGYFYGDAVNRLRQVLAVQYGYDTASKFRFGTPDVTNTYVRNAGSHAIFGSPQMRVFHVIGPEGVKQCVQIYHGPNGEQVWNIIKPCKF